MTHSIEQGTRSSSQLLLRLEELVEALDRRHPQPDRIGETEITADATRLRASAAQRIAFLRRPSGPRCRWTAPRERSRLDASHQFETWRGSRACPRCDGFSTRRVPRVSRALALWCTCLDCRHMWMSRPADRRWHERLYGRS